MPNTSGMNRIVCSEEGKHAIRNDPSVPVETYPFYHGTGIEGRDHDIATSQASSNGIILFYTPKHDTIGTVPPPPSRPTGTSMLCLCVTMLRARAYLSYYKHNYRHCIFFKRWVLSFYHCMKALCMSPAARGIETNPATRSQQHQPSTSRKLQQGEKGSHDWSTRLGLPAEPEVIMSHSGSRGIDAEAFTQVCLGIARRSPVLAFQKWTGDAQDAEVIRTANFSYFWLMNNISGKAMGGRSRGARCATKASIYSSNKNLILWSFPLVRDYDIRKQELLALSSDTRVLFIKGTKDWMEPEIIFGPVRREMKAKSWCIYVQDMDHNFNCKSDLQEHKVCNAIGTLAGIWLNGDPENNNSPWNPEDGTEMGMAWDAKRQEVVWTEWRPLGDKPPVADIVRPDIAGAL